MRFFCLTAARRHQTTHGTHALPPPPCGASRCLVCMACVCVCVCVLRGRRSPVCASIARVVGEDRGGGMRGGWMHSTAPQIFPGNGTERTNERKKKRNSTSRIASPLPGSRWVQSPVSSARSHVTRRAGDGGHRPIDAGPTRYPRVVCEDRRPVATWIVVVVRLNPSSSSATRTERGPRAAAAAARLTAAAGPDCRKCHEDV